MACSLKINWPPFNLLIITQNVDNFYYFTGNEDLVSKSKTIEPLPVTDSVCLTQHQDEGTSRPPKILRLDSHIHSFKKVKTTFDFSLLKNHVFLLYVFSNFLTSLALYSPFIFLVDRAKDGGFSIERAKWILSAAGIGSTLGKVIAGYLSELEGLNHVWFYISTLLVSGAIIALCPLLDDYLLLIFYGSTIGLFVGKYVLFSYQSSINVFFISIIDQLSLNLFYSNND